MASNERYSIRPFTFLTTHSSDDEQERADFNRDVKPAAGSQSSSDFPEGGRRAWLTVVGGSACLFSSFGWVNCVGIFQDYYSLHQLKDYSPAAIAWIGSFQVFFLVFGGVFIGKILDDRGPRLPLALGTCLHVFGLIMTSFAGNYASFLLAQGFLSPIGASMVFYPAFNCASTWFQKKRGMALGLVAAGASIGGILLPLVLLRLLPGTGFGWAVRTCSLIILGLLIFANFAVSSRLPPRSQPFIFKAFVRPLAEKPFALFTAAIFFFYWGMFIPLIFLVVEARSQGLSDHLATYLVPILNATSILGRTVPNAFADKVGHYNMMISMSALSTLLILALWLPVQGPRSSVAFACLYGITSGAGISLVPVLLAHISPVHEINIRSGTAFSFSAIAALTGSPIGGLILTSSDGNYAYVKLFGGVSTAIGTVLFVASRVAKGGWSAMNI